MTTVAGAGFSKHAVNPESMTADWHEVCKTCTACSQWGASRMEEEQRAQLCARNNANNAINTQRSEQTTRQ